MNEKRPSWDEYFMGIAFLTATRASCNYVKAGAVIVKNKRIIATGYNGAPSGIENCLERGCRKERMRIDFETKNSGHCIGEHAERNALLQISSERAKGSTIYSVTLPCSDCAKQIAGAGIERVVWFKIYKEPLNIVYEIFKEKDIKLEKIDLDLKKINYFLERVIQ